MVASSIHEVAGILGPELATQDLIPIYNSLINDIEDVRVTALNHLSCFVKVSLSISTTELNTLLDSLVNRIFFDSTKSIIFYSFIIPSSFIIELCLGSLAKTVALEVSVHFLLFLGNFSFPLFSQ